MTCIKGGSEKNFADWHRAGRFVGHSGRVLRPGDKQCIQTMNINNKYIHGTIEINGKHCELEGKSH
ncbi:hypothetical protein [Superficieibacter sp. HKU1]|uniref:hypothetical protein n=1 Tax=Superficieibacter sp. HKU1 TaxID=3031919 RepID=UPI0023E3064B|nr:hypothetical protein [Superficieibacter sp. HKU1]WES69212.1 hypothetical protein P0H77_04160 [Superficieibacter sp. HKU1]